MTYLVRGFLSMEAAIFAIAVLIHTGVLMRGFEHTKASVAESVIGLVLLGGLSATVVMPAASRTFGLAAQGFALAGTLVGLFTIAIGVGPRTALDLVIHGIMIALLVTGLVSVARQVAPRPLIARCRYRGGGTLKANAKKAAMPRNTKAAT